MMYAFGTVFGLLALWVSRLGSWAAVEVAGVTLALALVAVAILEQAPYERQKPKAKVQKAA